LVTRTAHTDAAGFFTLRGVAMKEIALTIAGSGFAHFNLRQSIDRDRVDLGSIALAPESNIQLVVTDGRDPVAEAVATIPPSRQTLRGDGRGRITINAVDAASALRAIVRAPGFLEQTVDVSAPLRAEWR